MRGESRKTDRDVLRDCWGRWTAILSLFAQNRPARRRLDPRAYEILRHELIAACRSLAEAAGPERLFYAGLEETVKPWLTLRVFEHTDREILSALLLHCREVECKLTGGKSRPAWPVHWKPALAIVAVGAVVGGLVWLLPKEGLSMLNTLRDAADATWLAIKYADNLQKTAAVAVIIVLASIYIASRSTRALR